MITNEDDFIATLTLLLTGYISSHTRYMDIRRIDLVFGELRQLPHHRRQLVLWLRRPNRLSQLRRHRRLRRRSRHRRRTRPRARHRCRRPQCRRRPRPRPRRRPCARLPCHPYPRRPWRCPRRSGRSRNRNDSRLHPRRRFPPRSLRRLPSRRPSGRIRRRPSHRRVKRGGGCGAYNNRNCRLHRRLRVGSGRYRSPHHRRPRTSRHEGAICVGQADIARHVIGCHVTQATRV